VAEVNQSRDNVYVIAVFYPIGLVVISMTSACVSLVLSRRDSFPLLRYRSFSDSYHRDKNEPEPEVAIGKYTFSKYDNGHHKSLCWQPINYCDGSIHACGVTTMTGSAGRHQHDRLTEDFCLLPKSSSNAVSSCGGSSRCGTDFTQSLTAETRQMGTHFKAATIPVIAITPPPQGSEPILSSVERQFTRQRCVGLGAAVGIQQQQQQQQQLEGHCDMPARNREHEHNNADYDKKLQNDNVDQDLDDNVVEFNRRDGSKVPQHRHPATIYPRSAHNSSSFSTSAAAHGIDDPAGNCLPTSNSVDASKMKSATEGSGCQATKRKRSTLSSSPKSVDRLIKRARIERYIDMMLFVATIVLIIGSVIATIVVAF